MSRDRTREAQDRRQFGERLRAARAAAELDLVTLSISVGVSTRTLRAWEAGETFPAVRNLLDIANVLGVSLDSLFYRSATSRTPMRYRRDETRSTGPK